MPGFAEYDRYDGLGLAELVRNREVSPSELLEEAIRRTEALNPRLNAVIYRMYEHARELARRPLGTGAFAGVPFLVKDLLQAYAGFPMSSGSAALRGWYPKEDATVVRRFKDAGLVTFGKTNVPEFGLVAYTEPDAFGPARNPWNLDCTPGGSSGGAAAAVAASIVPMAGANDGGGSIRIPAAACGLFGLKPTRGRVPVGPYFGEVWEGAAVDHVLTRSVRDSAAMLDAIEGPDLGAPYQIPRPAVPYRKEIETEPKPLRIAFLTDSPLGGKVSVECARAVSQTAEVLETLGHQVELAASPIDGLAVARAYLILYFGQVGADVLWLQTELGARAARQLEPATLALAAIGRSLSSARYVAARRSWHSFSHSMAEFHQSYDLLLTPTIAEPPIRVGQLKPGRFMRTLLRTVSALGAGKPLLASALVDRLASENLAKTPFTQLANLTGQPAMSIPAGWTADGLPLGAHFMAPWGEEATLFRIAAQLERARPWSDRRPPL